MADVPSDQVITNGQEHINQLAADIGITTDDRFGGGQNDTNDVSQIYKLAHDQVVYGKATELFQGCTAKSYRVDTASNLRMWYIPGQKISIKNTSTWTISISPHRRIGGVTHLDSVVWVRPGDIGTIDHS
jgi:hypothetical protein